MLQAPPFENSVQFYRSIIENDQCQFVALDDTIVVGWCDILTGSLEAMRHVGTLGIGVLPAFRGRGIGHRLIEASIAKAWSKGLTRIELAVRVDNPNARHLYDRLGFETEGIRKRSHRVDGVYIDCQVMALLR